MEDNPNLITRSSYRYIKSLNREEMSEYLSSLCDEAANKFCGIDLNELREVIGSVNGIGEKRLNEIMDAIAEHYRLDTNEEE